MVCVEFFAAFEHLVNDIECLVDSARFSIGVYHCPVHILVGADVAILEVDSYGVAFSYGEFRVFTG